jgi:hypothetical protein
MESSHNNAPYVKLPKLNPNRENWILWKAEVTSAVRSKGLSRFLKGCAKAPAKPQAPTNTALLEAYEKTVETHEEVYELCVQHNEKIKTVFYQTVPASLKLSVMCALTVAAAWTFLCEQFENTGALSQINILDEINALRTDDSSDLYKFLDRLDALKEKLANAGGLLNKANEIAAIIRLLPHEYQTTVCILLANAERDKKPLKPTELTTIICSIAHNNLSLDSRATSTEAYAVQSRNSKNQCQPSCDKSNDTCSNCGKKGHWRKDCWTKGGGKAGQRPSNWKDLVEASHSGQSNDSKEAVAVASPTPSSQANFAFVVQTDFSAVERANVVIDGHQRILDSGASHHFEPD